MNSKFEDKLAQLAFGELSPEDAARTERELKNDPEALRALSIYQDMREHLRELADVPDDQFSKERLRDAILTQGLRPVATRPANPRAWLWMPSAGFALGFALMLAINMRHRPTGNPNVLIAAPKNYVLGPSIAPPVRVADTTSGKTHAFGGFKAITAADSTDDGASKDPDEVEPGVVARIDNGFDDAAYDPDLGSGPTRTTVSPSASRVAVNGVSKAGESSASNSLVLIDQDKDDQTGACKATEVSNSSNVLVGG